MDLDAKHNRAIRDEVADRLRTLLSHEPSGTPPRLLQLLRRLDEMDSVPSKRARLAARSRVEPVTSWLHGLVKRS